MSGKAITALAIFWLLGLVNFFHPLLQDRYLGDLGDTRLNLYVLEHEYKVATDKAYPGTFASAPMWYPDASTDSLARSDMFTGALPFYFLPRLFLSRDHAYQAFFLIVATLNFLAFYWLCRSLGVESAVAAALAAWVFAFGMNRVQHTVHSQLFLEFWGVAFVAFWVRFLRSPARISLFGAALFLGLQTLSSPYTGVFYTLAGLSIAALYLAVDRRPLWLRQAKVWRGDFFGLAGAAAVALAPSLLLLLPYLRKGSQLAQPWSVIAQRLPAPGFWFVPLQGTLWWFAARLHGYQGECYFLGAVFLLLWAAAFVLFALSRLWREDGRGRLALVCASAAVVLIALARAWWALYRWFPGAAAIRDTARIAIVANLLILLAGALVLDELVRRRRVLLYACVLLALAENCLLAAVARPIDEDHPAMFSYPRDWYAPEYAEMCALLQGAQSAYVYEDPRARWPWAHEANVRLAGQQEDVPVVNGYSVDFPPGYGLRMSPREVLAKGTHFDFTGFRYLVPVSLEDAMREELRESGLALERRGHYFAVYAPYPFRPGAPEPAYDAGFRILDAAPQALHVLVTNRSTYPWQPFGPYATDPGYRIFDPQTDKVVADGAEHLPRVLFPQESALMTLHVTAPAAAGHYLVRLMVVRQKIRWFGAADPAREVQFPLTVAP